jgi:tyrosinase
MKLNKAGRKRFVDAVKRMKSHDAAGNKSTSGGVYQKYVVWHADETRRKVAELKNFVAVTSGADLGIDHFISITIDGQQSKPVGPISLNDTVAIETFLNGLLLSQVVHLTFPAGSIRLSFAVNTNSAGEIEIAVSNCAFSMDSIKCDISGVQSDFIFSQTVLGDYELSNMDVAHSGSLFLPWHRTMLRLFEVDLQNADDKLGNNGKITLPYWDWTKQDSGDHTNKKSRGALWQEDFMGPNGVRAGPFLGSNVVKGPFRVSKWEVFDHPNNFIKSIERDFAVTGSMRDEIGRLPTKKDVKRALQNVVYDKPPFDQTVKLGAFRNELEGFITYPASPNSVELHNIVHVWIGGTMESVSVSVNDPVFFLHHCNVDRIWALWQRKHPKKLQYPDFGPSPGRRKTDFMLPWDGTVSTEAIRAVDILNWQKFDSSVEPFLGKGYKYDGETRVKLSKP